MMAPEHTDLDATTSQPESWGRASRRAWAEATWPIRASILLLTMLVGLALVADYLPLPNPERQATGERLLPPGSAGHWLGTDGLGRDILARVIYGARYSLSVGVASVLVALAIGLPLGVAGGYFGNPVDRVVVSMVEMLMTFPSILLALVIVAIAGQSLTNVAIAVGIALVPTFARQARSSTQVVRSQEYILAARSVGANSTTILWTHVLPNIAAPMLVVATMGLGGAILDAAGLAFLGLSGDPNRPEWGNMLTGNREHFSKAPWIVLAPGLAITFSVLSFNLLGDWLRDWLDPRMDR